MDLVQQFLESVNNSENQVQQFS
uniref:Uncharacterized protein n=1 Tax=Arundo donax TaxID=35708 RepID=A0A0A9GTC9_ARUDO